MQGISIRMIEANQGTAVTLVEQGAPQAAASRNAPLITGRPLLIQVYWQLDPGWTQREIEARLALYDGAGAQLRVLSDVLEVAGEPQELFVGGAFHFIVEPELLTTDTRFSVGLFEVDPAAIAGAERPREPSEGQLTLELDGDPMHMRVALVPVAIGGVEPDMDWVVPRIEEELFQTNPVQSLELTVSATQMWPGEFGSLGSPGEAIGAVSAAREADAPDANVYYLGVLPVGCCQHGGGFGYIPDDTPEDAPNRIAIVAVPENNDPVQIYAHEVGHMQGRDHAPCGAGAPHMPGYPYGDECRIGARGFGIADGGVRGEAYTYDYMSYQIGTQWTSDFVYARNAERIRVLSSWGGAAPPTSGGRTLHVVRWGDGRSSSWITAGLTSALVRADATVAGALTLDDGSEVDVFEVAVADHDARAYEIALPERATLESAALALDL